jgi:uncharacterized membrane protein YvbJ
MASNTDNENSEVKENFCGACAAIPLAIAGATGASVGTQKHGTTKKIMLWGGIAITIISIIIVIIYLKTCKNCK